MQRKTWLALAILLMVIITSFLLFYFSVINTRIESAGYYVRVTNSGNETLINKSVDIYPVEWLPFNVSSGVVTHSEGNVTIHIKKDRINVTIGTLAPDQTLYFQIENITVEGLPSFPTYSQIRGIYIGGWSSGTVWESDIRIYARSPLARFSVASLFSHYYEGSYLLEYRTHAAELLYFLFLTISLIIAGVPISRLGIGRKYPFITLLILALNSLTYVFIGSGQEVNFLPDLAVLKQWLPITFIYHGDYSHISMNFVYFALISSIMEVWLNIKKDAGTFIGWYLLTYVPNISMSISSFIYASGFSYGLSIIVILMAISFWTYVIENWRCIIKKRLDIFMMLLGGIAITAFSNWLLVLILNGETYSAWDLLLARGHVFWGTVGITISVIYLFRERIRMVVGSIKKQLEASNQMS